VTHKWTIIREAHSIMDAKPYAPKFLEKHYVDLLHDDGDANKSPAIDLEESSSDEDVVELLGDNKLCSGDGGDIMMFI
jgi:translation initiation factor 2 beta subunit (eIF-2beta)/eIF-5